MSAFVCSDKHFAVVAKYLFPGDLMRQQFFADHLKRENIKSVNHRYNEHTRFRKVNLDDATADDLRLYNMHDALRLLRSALAVGHPDDDRLVSVLAASASTGSGVSELMAAIDNHADWLDTTGRRAKRREHRARTEVLTALRTALDLQLRFEPDQISVLHDAVARVVRKEQSPREAAEELAGKLR